MFLLRPLKSSHNTALFVKKEVSQINAVLRAAIDHEEKEVVRCTASAACYREFGG